LPLAFDDLVQDHAGHLRRQLVTISRSGASIARLAIWMPWFWSSLSPFQLLEGLQRADQRHATARDHAFFHGRTGGVQGVFDAGLLFLHFDSVAAPTLITATPPASLATRSCSFSRS
jgi:hypothetical protein